jgi:hypothetical protein
MIHFTTKYGNLKELEVIYGHSAYTVQQRIQCHFQVSFVCHIFYMIPQVIKVINYVVLQCKSAGWNLLVNLNVRSPVIL